MCQNYSRMTGYLNVCTVMASNKAVSEPRRARKLGRASIGFSVSGVVVSVIAVVISVCFLTTRDDSCEYIFYQGSCYRYKTYVRSSGLCVSGVKTSSGYCYSNYCSNYKYRGSCYKSRKYVENSVSCSSGVMSSSSYCYFSCVHYEYAGSPCLTIGTPLANCWYSLGRPVTIGTPMVLSVFGDWFSVPFVKNSQKTVKIATITIGVLIVTCQRRVSRIHKAAQTPLPCETSITCVWAVATARCP